MALTESEQRILLEAGTTGDLTLRRRAVAVYLGKRDDDQKQARSLLVQSYLAATQPSFHLIPRGDAMVDEARFNAAYASLAAATQKFSDVSESTLVRALEADPACLAPLRMIAGLTHSELAVAMRLTNPDSTIREDVIKDYERGTVSRRYPGDILRPWIARTIIAVLNRDILSVPPHFQTVFHSKIDRRDTKSGWLGVARDAQHGVPYEALLYQRYVGGSWRQVQDAYSEAKGDNVLELPLKQLLEDNAIPYYRSPSGATGAQQTLERYGIKPGPDFVLPDESPTVVIECKVCEDGGTARDKAERLQALAHAASAKGLIACVVIDGKGWRARPNSLADVVAAAEGRVYTLSTMPLLLNIPEIAALCNSRPRPHA